MQHCASIPYTVHCNHSNTTINDRMATGSLVLLLYGLPCGGKSTVANHISSHINEYTKHKVTVHCISVDQIYNNMIHHNNVIMTDTVQLWHNAIQQSHSELSKLLLNMRRENDGCDGDALYHLIVIDDNNVHRSMRLRYSALANEYSANYMEIYVDVSTDIAIQRNESRQIKLMKNGESSGSAAFLVSHNVIFRMADILQRENIIKQCTHHIDSNVESIQHLTDSIPYHRIIQSLLLPARQPTVDLLQSKQQASDTARSITRKNVVHQCDIILRKLISKHVAQCNINKNMFAAGLNTIRQDTLQSIRAGRYVAIKEHSTIDQTLQYISDEFEFQIIIHEMERAVV